MAIDRFANRPRNLATVLGVFAALFIAFFFRAAPLQLDPPRAVNAPEQFDTARALTRLSRVLDGTPHPVDSDALDATRARLLREISAIGYVPVVHSHNSCVALDQGGMRCARVQNIYFSAGPASGPALVLTAHYDSVDISPGFGDDGIGVAVWLEVAHVLRQQVPQQPVVFLFSDGEEVALLGARAFVDNQQDYGVDVAQVINLEARGVRGPAMMFETSHPNAGVVSAWANNGARPFSNSMMTAIYELLPNGTDMTAHLAAGSAGINIAIADGSELYHSNRDDLTSLDPASVQHMGDQALGATRAFLAADWNSDAAGGEIVYADIASRVFVTLPQTAAQALLVLCLAGAALLLMRPSRDRGWGKPDWRAAALPPLLFAGAAMAAFALQQLLHALRPESAFWTAHPQALNMTVFAATQLVAALLLALLAPRAQAGALFAAGWWWLLLPGIALSVAIPGFVMFFLIPGVVLAVAGAFGWWFPRWQSAAYVIASGFLALNFFPIIHLIGVTLGLGNAAMYAVMEAMVLAPMLALLSQSATHRVPVLLALCSVLGIAGFVTVARPAYSVERPLALNFIAHYDNDAQMAVLFAGAGAGSLPAEVRDQFVSGPFDAPPGIASNLPARQLDFTEPLLATATLLNEEVSQGQRVVRLRLDAAGARGVRLNIPAEAGLVRIRYEDQVHELRQPDSNGALLEIVGRTVHGAVVDLTFTAGAKTEILVQGMWSGLPDQAQVFADRRPDSTVRNRMGDITVSSKKQNL